MGQSHIEEESLATHCAAESSAGEIVTESGGRPPEKSSCVTFASANK